MDDADSPRRGDLDGRGNLSQSALRDFTLWFLQVALDQVQFMASLFDLDTLSRRLRMTEIANHGIDKLDFELISRAVSAVNGCGLCVTSHEKKLRSHDVSREAIQSAVRIAATVHAVAVALEFEQSKPVAAGSAELAA
jgi:AhpD family alkylhydroperoxidase